MSSSDFFDFVSLLSGMLIVAGIVLSLCGALSVIRSSFKQNFLIGLFCLTIPLATYLVPAFFWKRLRVSFYVQVIGGFLMIIGVGIMFLDPTARSSAKAFVLEDLGLRDLMSLNVTGDVEEETFNTSILGGILKAFGKNTDSLKNSFPDTLKASAKEKNDLNSANSTLPSASLTEAYTTSGGSSEKEIALLELYDKLKKWYLVLQEKTPGKNASVEEVAAFNIEYSQYEELLDQYKKQSVEFSNKSPDQKKPSR